MTRRPLIAGNWKMHKLPSEVAAYVSDLRIALEGHRNRLDDAVEVALAPAYPALPALGAALEDSGIGLAAQNVHSEPSGAFTGEVSVAMLEDLSCRYVLLGHSERRRDHAESNADVARKAAALAGSSIAPILCVGETLEERQRGQTLEIVGEQLETVLDTLSSLAAQAGGGDEADDDGLMAALVVAYEPVWAIGTGRTATPELAQQVHASIRERLVGRMGAVGHQTRILYGGSVKPLNARTLLEQADIDGALVGGASLEPEAFAEIIRAALPAVSPAA